MPEGAASISLEEFLECMRHALLAPLAPSTVQKLREMFDEGAKGQETIGVCVCVCVFVHVRVLCVVRMWTYAKS